VASAKPGPGDPGGHPSLTCGRRTDPVIRGAGRQPQAGFRPGFGWPLRRLGVDFRGARPSVW